MVQNPTILVALCDSVEADELADRLHAAGYEVIEAESPEDALRSAVGSKPALVVVDADMPLVGGYELHARMSVTGLALPPMLVVAYSERPPLIGDRPDGVFVLTGSDTAHEAVVRTARLVLLSADVQGDFGADHATLHGDLARTSFGDLVAALEQHRVTGTVSFTGAVASGLVVEDGAIVDAWRGPTTGLKAFNRLAGLPSGGFTLVPGETTGKQTLSGDSATMVMDAIEERAALDEALARLPGLDARVEIKLTPEFFAQTYTDVERTVMARAQQAANLGELLNQIDLVDGDLAQAVASLNNRGLIDVVHPAGRVHVVTDSTADLLAPDARRLGIEVVGVSIVFGTEVLKDGIDISPDGFQRRLSESSEPPTTHAASKGEFLETFRRLIPSGDVVAVLCSSGLSHNHEHAAEAVEDGRSELAELRRAAGTSTEPRIHLVDSHQCSGPLGLMAIFAQRMAGQGMGSEEVARRVAGLGRRWRTVLMVPTLEYLHRGRGVGTARDASKRRPNVRWLLSLEDGRLEVVDSVPLATARDQLIERLVDGIDPQRPSIVSLVHASAPAEAAWMRTMLRSRLEIAELVEHQIGPAVMCNTGPGTVGAAILQPTDGELEALRPT